jgi:hypothetical protein
MKSMAASKEGEKAPANPSSTKSMTLAMSNRRDMLDIQRLKELEKKKEDDARFVKQN